MGGHMELTITTFQRVAIIVTFVLYTLAVVAVAVYARRQKSSVNSYVDDFYTCLLYTSPSPRD